MTLYDSLLLLRAHWRWFVVLPALSVSVTLGVLLNAPRDYTARAVVRIDAAIAPTRVVAILSSRTLAEKIGATQRVSAVSRASDAQLIEVSTHAATPEEATRIVGATLTAVNSDERHRHAAEIQRHSARLARALDDRALLMTRFDRFVLTDYAVLASRIETLRNGAPATPADALEIIDPVVASRAAALSAYPLIISAVAAVIATVFAIRLRAWWVAERTVRTG